MYRRISEFYRHCWKLGGTTGREEWGTVRGEQFVVMEIDGSTQWINEDDLNRV